MVKTRASFVAPPRKGENGISDVILGLYYLASVIVLTSSVFSAFSSLLAKLALLMLVFCRNLEVKVSSKASEKEDTLDDDEPEDAYTDGRRVSVRRIGWLSMKQKEKRNKKSTVLLL